MPYKDKIKQVEYQRNWQANRPAQEKRDGKLVVRRRNREVVAKAKSAPCADCGNSYPYYVMDFDHLPDQEKFKNVNVVANTYGTKRVLAEIAKCEVVCANCHRIRTFNRTLASRQIGKVTRF